MSTHTNGSGSGRRKPRFTVAQAARAFRQARGDEPKVELTDEEGRPIRWDEQSRRFVLCDAAGKRETVAQERASHPPRDSLIPDAGSRDVRPTPDRGCTMSTRANGSGSGRRKPRFTVAQAARAFRKARGDTPKVLLLDDDDHEIRRDENGYFVLCDRSPADRNSRGNRRFTYDTIR